MSSRNQTTSSDDNQFRQLIYKRDKLPAKFMRLLKHPMAQPGTTRMDRQNTNFVSFQVARFDVGEKVGLCLAKTKIESGSKKLQQPLDVVFSATFFGYRICSRVFQGLFQHRICHQISLWLAICPFKDVKDAVNSPELRDFFESMGIISDDIWRLGCMILPYFKPTII